MKSKFVCRDKFVCRTSAMSANLRRPTRSRHWSRVGLVLFLKFLLLGMVGLFVPIVNSVQASFGSGEGGGGGGGGEQSVPAALKFLTLTTPMKLLLFLFLTLGATRV